MSLRLNFEDQFGNLVGDRQYPTISDDGSLIRGLREVMQVDVTPDLTYEGRDASFSQVTRQTELQSWRFRPRRQLQLNELFWPTQLQRSSELLVGIAKNAFDSSSNDSSATDLEADIEAASSVRIDYGLNRATGENVFLRMYIVESFQWTAEGQDANGLVFLRLSDARWFWNSERYTQELCGVVQPPSTYWSVPPGFDVASGAQGIIDAWNDDAIEGTNYGLTLDPNSIGATDVPRGLLADNLAWAMGYVPCVLPRIDSGQQEASVNFIDVAGAIEPSQLTENALADTTTSEFPLNKGEFFFTPSGELSLEFKFDWRQDGWAQGSDKKLITKSDIPATREPIWTIITGLYSNMRLVTDFTPGGSDVCEIDGTGTQICYPKAGQDAGVPYDLEDGFPAATLFDEVGERLRLQYEWLRRIGRSRSGIIFFEDWNDVADDATDGLLQDWQFESLYILGTDNIEGTGFGSNPTGLPLTLRCLSYTANAMTESVPVTWNAATGGLTNLDWGSISFADADIISVEGDTTYAKVLKSFPVDLPNSYVRLYLPGGEDAPDIGGATQIIRAPCRMAAWSTPQWLFRPEDGGLIYATADAAITASLADFNATVIAGSPTRSAGEAVVVENAGFFETDAGKRLIAQYNKGKYRIVNVECPDP